MSDRPPFSRDDAPDRLSPEGTPGRRRASASEAASEAGALARALGRWGRATRAAGSTPAADARAAGAAPMGPPPPAAAGDAAALLELARRLDDSGCAYGRVSGARLEHLTRAYDRLETKLNAVLMAVMGTFLSTLASLLLYYVRGGTH